MNVAAEAAAGPDNPESIVQLRGDRPRVVRLSRKAIGLASAAGLALIGAVLLYALKPVARIANSERLNTSGIAMADDLVSAPKDYSQIPKLGPPLPGDLGRPILAARDSGAIAALPPDQAREQQTGQAASAATASQQRRIQERLAATTSGLFIGGSAGSRDTLSSPENAHLTTLLPDGSEPASSAGLSRAGAKVATAEPTLPKPISDDVLQAGSVIPAALITGIRSDQPGLVTAQVSQNVYDSLTGRRLLIPQGARLIGKYFSDVGAGQRRVQLAWNRLIMPSGQSMDLDAQPATDPSGYAGLEDRVNSHWGGVLKAALVSTILGIGGELGSGSSSDLGRALRFGMQDSVNRAGEQIVSRELAIHPTLTIRPGFPVRVLVSRDLVFVQAQ